VASPAPAEAVARVHRPEHVAAMQALRGRSAALDPDTSTSPGSVDAAFLAAGAAIEAVEALFDGRAGRSFALVRPPGHHAEADHAMGFCLFNNVAVAAEHARRTLGCERVLIVDWDVHHGNGTQHIFEARRDVLVFNTHQFPFYPGTGALQENGRGEGEGFTVNVPLPKGLGDSDYGAVFREILTPVATQFKPDLVLVSAGFDAHRDDPLAQMRVTEEGFAHLCGSVVALADQLCQGRVALVLEGGYNLEALARSVRASVGVLAGERAPEVQAESPKGSLVLREAAKFHRGHWSI
jgi:acetoin utilization deacetylase AcuC-like enzyme